MKRIVLSLSIAAFAFSTIIFHEVATLAQGAGKKKLYISSIKAKGVPAPLASRVREGVRLAIIEGYGEKYHILDDDAVKVMFKQAEAIMATGCDDTSCVSQIADGVNADEIVYGNVQIDGGRVKISLTGMERDKETLVLRIKNVAAVECLESQADHYAHEAGRKLMNKSYQIKKAPDDIDGTISLKAIETEKIGAIKGVKGIEGLGIAVLKFTTPDESVQNILAVLKNYVKEGDASFQSGDYNAAVAKYGMIFDKVESTIRPESRQKIEGFVGEVKKRVESAYAMNYKVKIDKAEPVLASGDYKGARGKFNDILDDMNERVPQKYLPAMKDLDKGLRDRLDATWAAQFKKDVEKVDSRLQGKTSADEPFLKNVLEEYGEVETSLTKVPSNAAGEGVAGIGKALKDRKDSVAITIAALYHKKGDSAYGEYRFDKARGEYDTALAWSKTIQDGEKRAELEKNSADKLDACFTTGKNYMASRVKSFADRAEVYNLEGKASDARRMMKDAYRLITGPMRIFATEESVGFYNSMATVLKMDKLTQGGEPDLFAVLIAEKERIELHQKELSAIERMKEYKRLAKIEQDNFTKIGGGKTKEVGGIYFVYIPGGSFIMGLSITKKVTTVDSFWIGKYEVNQRQYFDIMGKNPSNWKGDDLPVEQVSWNDANTFCQKFSGKYVCTMRLPKGTEWEYACRAGTKTQYYWGDTVDGNFCWYNANSGNKTHSIGQKLPNYWELYDMIGNVGELCGDIPNSEEDSMLGSLFTLGFRVINGGSWQNDTYSRTLTKEKKFNDIGFRVVIPGED